MTPIQWNASAKSAALKAGFERCGVARLEPIGREEYVRRWLAQGMAGSMEYLHRHLDKRLDPRQLLPGAQSAIVVALVYKQPRQSRDREEPESKQPSSLRGVSIENRRARGRVAMYAWGEDYHTVIRDKLRAVEAALRSQAEEPFDCKICVDTVPIIERELAAAAGVGWIGKNTLTMHPVLGSFFFLGVLLTTLEIAPDEPIPDHCGTCTACLDACPTEAFINPYQMDASRCISYLTIEHRGDISKPFQDMMGDWIFGCDVCQDVCPHNRKAPNTREPRFAARADSSSISLDVLSNWSEAQYSSHVRGSAMARARMEMLRRNANIAQSNLRTHT